MEDRRIRIFPDVARALAEKLPVVALESTVITHGLPFPENRRLAEDMETEVRTAGCTPATVGVLRGQIQVGLSAADLDQLAHGEGLHKLSVRDLGPAAALGWSGGTTVAATMLAAQAAGIRVFATGGIGGVHRAGTGGTMGYLPADISADLPVLARTAMIVVCAGAKAILDLPGTLEYLETASVPVIGYQTDDFPAFYSRSSGLPVSARAESPEQVAAIARAHWGLGNPSAVLVTVPPPLEAAMPRDEVETAVGQALGEAEAAGVRGQAVTPFLLDRMAILTGGASLQANLALLRHNARTASAIAAAFSMGERLMRA